MPESFKPPGGRRRSVLNTPVDSLGTDRFLITYSWFTPPTEEVNLCARGAGASGQQVVEVLFAEGGEGGVVLAEDRLGEVALALLEFENALFDGVLGDEAIGEDGAGLADAVGAVNRLGFDGGVPPGVEEIDVIGGGEIEAGAAGFQAKQEDGAIGIGLEMLDTFLTIRGGAVEILVLQARLIEARLQEREEAGELREHQCFVAFFGDFGELIEQYIELGADGLRRHSSAPP